MVKREDIMETVKAAVCAQLKSPASAQFPDDLITITEEVGGYQVDGYVDSQNSYGAMIRNDYSVSIGVVGDKLVVKSATVGKKANEARGKNFAVNYTIYLVSFAVLGLVLYLIYSSI